MSRAANTVSERAPTQQILGVRFFDGSAEEAVQTMRRNGGVLVVPAAPALVNIQYDSAYRDALIRSDLAIADSGFMVLLWKLLHRRAIRRVSGLVYLKFLLALPEMRAARQLFFVLPSEAAKMRANDWLQCSGFVCDGSDLYVAPHYREVADTTLVGELQRSRPANIVVAIGGGRQEKLGLYLRDNLDYRPAIHCIGAALGFLTGDQKPIPDWADHLYLGWLLRLGRNPRLYLRRFWVAHELPRLILRYGSELPPLTIRKLKVESKR